MRASVVCVLAAPALLAASCASAEDASTTVETVAGSTLRTTVDSSPTTENLSPTATIAARDVSSSSWDDGTITLSDGTPTRDWGVVAAPITGGPYPVVVLLHGNHPTCPTDTGGRTWPCPVGTEEPNHEGLGYLADALAARGFVAVAPGINATLADMSKLALVGHSVGGQDSGLMAAGRTAFSEPVAGVVMLQPALNDSAALPLADVPSVVVLSECDGDTGVRGGDFVTTELLRTRRTPAAVAVLERANHNFTNANLDSDWIQVNAPACDAGSVLGPAEQQAELASIVPELAHAVLDDGDGVGWAGSIFSEPTPPVGVQLGVVSPGEPVPPAALQSSGMTLTFCPEGYYTPFAEPGTEPCHRPELAMMVGFPQTIAASWDAAGASLTLPVTAGPGDVARLRVLADFADERLTQPLRLRLSAGGTSTDVDIALPEIRREVIDPFIVSFGLAMWSTFTLPLPDGASSVTVEVLGPAAGSMQVLSLSFLTPL